MLIKFIYFKIEKNINIILLYLKIIKMFLKIKSYAHNFKMLYTFISQETRMLYDKVYER